jgi:DNA-binding CsgD family transcriptional regulator
MEHPTETARLSWGAADIVAPEDLAGDFLSSVASFLGATSTIVYSFSSRGRLTALGGTAAGAVPEYERRFAPADPLMQASMAHRGLPFVVVQQSDRAELLDDTAFRDSDVYRDHYRPLGLEHFVFLFPSENPLGEAGMVGFLFGRDRRAPPFETGRLAQLGELDGALRAAVRRVWRTRAVQHQRDALASLLARADAGAVAMLNERRELVWASDDAESFLRRHAGALASIQYRAEQLTTALTRPGEVEAPWTFRDRLGEKHILSGEFEIVRDAWLRPITACRFAVDAAPAAGGPRFTTAENRVLEGLVAGLSNKELGAKLGVSADTVRSHVRKVLAKLGVDSRLKAATWALKNRGGGS